MLKVHILDSGLAARLLRVTPERIADLDLTTLQQYGHLLETFVVGEVFKQATWRDDPVTLGHWRTGDGAEVDLVIEADDGSVCAIEVKAGTRVRDRDLAGLRSFRQKVGDRCACGVVLAHRGNHEAGRWVRRDPDRHPLERLTRCGSRYTRVGDLLYVATLEPGAVT